MGYFAEGALALPFIVNTGQTIPSNTFVNAVAGTTTQANPAVDLAGNGEKTLGICIGGNNSNIAQTTNSYTAGMEVRVATVYGTTCYLTVDGSGTAIAAGDLLGSNASGEGIKVTANNAWFGAEALEAATTDGAIIRVLIRGGYIGA